MDSRRCSYCKKHISVKKSRKQDTHLCLFCQKAVLYFRVILLLHREYIDACFRSTSGNLT